MAIYNNSEITLRRSNCTRSLLFQNTVCRVTGICWSRWIPTFPKQNIFVFGTMLVADRLRSRSPQRQRGLLSNVSSVKSLFYCRQEGSFSIASWITIGSIERDQLGRKGRPDYVTIKALCMHIANDRVIYSVGRSMEYFHRINTMIVWCYVSELYQWRLSTKSGEISLGFVSMWQMWTRDQRMSMVVHVTRKSFGSERMNRTINLGRASRFNRSYLGFILWSTSPRSDG